MTTTTKANAEIANFVSLAADPTMLPSMPGLTPRKRSVGALATVAALVVAVVSRIGF